MASLREMLSDLCGFIRYTVLRFLHDKSLQRAAGLSYTTLLAMVPFLAVALAVLSAFPVFGVWKEQIMTLVLNNFLPETGQQVGEYLGGFLQNTGQMTALGTMVLGITAVMLLGAIETVMNDVFRVTTPRKILSRIVVFWTLLTVGPLLLGLSVSLASYVFAMRHLIGADALVAQLGHLVAVVPFLLSATAFSLLFLGMPNRAIHVGDGILGAVIAAVLFDLLKRGFGFYIISFPTYQTIYGAVAVVPIFLLWMYLAWIIVLFGAQIAAARSEWRASRRAGLFPDPPGSQPGPLERLIAVLRVLEYLKFCFASASKPPGYRRLLRVLKLGARDLNWALAALRREKLVERTESRRWVLSGDLSQITLATLDRRLGLFLDADRLMLVEADSGWPLALRERLIRLEQTRQTVFDIDLGTLLEAPRDAGD